MLMEMVSGADPGNQYGAPWAFAATGVGYNVQAVQKALGANAPVDSWTLVFDPVHLAKRKGCGVSFLDESVDVFAVALHYMLKDTNGTNQADYQADYQATTRPRSRC